MHFLVSSKRFKAGIHEPYKHVYAFISSLAKASPYIEENSNPCRFITVIFFSDIYLGFFVIAEMKK